MALEVNMVTNRANLKEVHHCALALDNADDDAEDEGVDDAEDEEVDEDDDEGGDDAEDEVVDEDDDGDAANIAEGGAMQRRI